MVLNRLERVVDAIRTLRTRMSNPAASAPFHQPAPREAIHKLFDDCSSIFTAREPCRAAQRRKRKQPSVGPAVAKVALCAGAMRRCAQSAPPRERHSTDATIRREES